MLILKNAYYFYNQWFNENLDERLEGLPLAGPPIYTVILIGLYLYFVTGRGQKWMKNREPFQLNYVINVYNIFQVVSNAYVCYLALSEAHLQENFRIFCIPEPKHDLTLIGNKIVRYSYFFYFLKLTDLLDTVFFVLRKKDKQVTFLHVYHHAGVALFCYIYLKMYSGGGVATAFGVVNSFVHVVMYSYYFLTSYNSEMKKSIWWKKYITQLQLVQFVILFVYMSSTIFFVECANSKLFSWFGLIQASVMMAMFGDFYVKSYIMKKA